MPSSSSQSTSSRSSLSSLSSSWSSSSSSTVTYWQPDDVHSLAEYFPFYDERKTTVVGGSKVPGANISALASHNGNTPTPVDNPTLDAFNGGRGVKLTHGQKITWNPNCPSNATQLFFAILLRIDSMFEANSGTGS